MSDNSTNTIKLSALLEDAKAGGKVILDKAVTKENIGSGILLLLVTVLALKLLAWVERRRQRRGKPTPYPPRHWLLGNVPQVAAVVNQGHHIDKLILELMPKYGKIFTLKLGPLDFTVVCDPEASKEVLASYNWPKSPTYKHLHPFVGERSLLVAPTNVWHKQRQAFNPAFQYNFLKGLVPIFIDKTRLMLKNLERAAATNEVVKLHETSALLTLDIICEVAVSTNFHMQEGQGKEKPEIFKLFSALLDDCAFWNDRPHLYWVRKVPFFMAKINRMQRRLDKLLMDVINKQIQEGASKVGGPKNILQLALETAHTEGSGLDKLDVLSQVKTFLFAGHDTTATTIAMAVYELSRHPEKEARLVEEIRAVTKGREPTADNLNDMKYLGAIIREVLRLWPPGGTARLAPPGATLKGFDVGTHVLYVPHFPMHRDPDIWGADCAEFKPERWADDIAVSKLHPYSYMPFSRGPRDCIGQTFALLEAKTVLCMLYQKYTFTYAHDKPEEQAYKIVSHPKYGVPVQVLMRNPVRPSLGSTCGSVNGSIRERDSVNLEQLDVAWSV